MPRSSKQKLKLLYIRQLLLERSDEEHPVSVSDILAWLEENDIPAERKSIYADLDALRDYGMDILRRGGPGGGYFVGARDFELAELKLLVDAVETSKFITEAKTFALISKIEGLASESQARGLQRQVVVKNRIKTMDESIYYKVDELFDAISRDRAIRFRYYEYTVQKTRAFRHDGKIYEVSPYALTWDHEKYYLIAFDAAAGKIKHFRVDKLAEIDVTDEKRAGRAAFENLDLGAYATSHFGMPAPKPRPRTCSVAVDQPSCIASSTFSMPGPWSVSTAVIFSSSMSTPISPPPAWMTMAKTQYSFSDNPKKLGAPEGFTVVVRRLKVCAGAGFIVAYTGDILTMPGLPKVPAAERIDVDENGVISGLF